MLVRASILSGLTTAVVASALMALMYAAWDQFQLVWPMAFVPLFITGAYAVSRAGSAVNSSRRAVLVGAIAGWLAGMVVKGGGYGLIGDIIVGIVGGLIAGWLLPQIGIVIGGGFVAAIINAFIGAVILLIVLRLIMRAA